MTNITQLMTAFFDFLSSQDKNWSLCTFPFMASFLVFFAIYIGLNRYRQTWTKAYVIAFSLFFAFKANGVLMWLLPIVTISSWYLTRFMMRLKRGKVRKIGLAIVILTELLPLLYYKYSNFTLEIFHELLRSNFSPEKMLLPVGISFFTFQAISYTVIPSTLPFSRSLSLVPSPALKYCSHRFRHRKTMSTRILFIKVYG